MVDINELESLELQLHKARQNQLNFKTLAFKVFESGVMTYSEFQVLNEAAKASPDYNDALTLNKLTTILNCGRVS
jgi:hypothetical protein